MTKSRKLLDRIRNNPKTVSFDDLDKALRDCGFTVASHVADHRTTSIRTAN